MNLLTRHRVPFTATLKTFQNVVSPPNVNTHHVVVRGFAAVASAAGNLASESASCKENKVGEPFWLLKAMIEKSVEPDLVAFNAVIHGLCLERRLCEAEEVFEEMNRKGMTPDEKTYTSLIHLLCDKGQPTRAYKVLNEMIDSRFSPSVATYNKLIRAYSRYKIEEAVGILRGMAERGLSLDAASYRPFISAFLENSELGKALEMKKEMVEKGILPDADTYESLIRGLCRRQQRRLSEAFDLFQEMLRGGLSPGKYTYYTLMNACCAEGQFSKVFHLHDEMVKKGFLPDFVTGFSPSLVTYNALIYGYFFFGRVEEAVGIFRGMAEMGLSPDASYNIVISGFCRNQKPGKAFEMKLEADENSTAWVDEDTYESLMDRAVKTG